MVTFRNNNNVRRNNFRRNDRNFKSNGERPKFGSNYSNNENFKRRAPGRNNHNAPKLIEKYKATNVSVPKNMIPSIRSDHAGETGAVWVYLGAKCVFWNKKIKNINI